MCGQLSLKRQILSSRSSIFLLEDEKMKSFAHWNPKCYVSGFSDRNCVVVVGQGAGDQVGKLPGKERPGLVVIRGTVKSLA